MISDFSCTNFWKIFNTVGMCLLFEAELTTVHVFFPPCSSYSWHSVDMHQWGSRYETGLWPNEFTCSWVVPSSRQSWHASSYILFSVFYLNYIQESERIPLFKIVYGICNWDNNNWKIYIKNIYNYRTFQLAPHRGRDPIIEKYWARDSSQQEHSTNTTYTRNIPDQTSNLVIISTCSGLQQTAGKNVVS